MTFIASSKYSNVFTDCPSVTIYGYSSSYAETFAKQNAINFTALPDFIYGDVDGDGQVTSLDFALVKRYLLGTTDTFTYEYGKEAADVDGDGQISSIDFAMIKSYLLGKITVFKADKTI